MSFEHEIPKGSKLYFDKSANLKRKIEHLASELLVENGFKEISTPYFLETKNIKHTDKAIYAQVDNNEFLFLRPDSTIEVLRLAINRLKSSSKKWFYIQPIFLYPSIEKYQIGVEHIESKDTSYILDILVKLLLPYRLDFALQLSNINIVNLLINKYNINKELFEPLNLEELLKTDIKWLSKLAKIHKIEDLEDLSDYPKDISFELEELKNNAIKIDKNNLYTEEVLVEPLFFDDFKYYNSIYFRIFSENTVFARGGIYKDEDTLSLGFAIYTDELISKLMN